MQAARNVAEADAEHLRRDLEASVKSEAWMKEMVERLTAKKEGQ